MSGMMAAQQPGSTQAFFDAIQDAQTEKAVAMLDEDPSLIDQKNAKGQSPVLVALYHQHQALAELLRKRSGALDLFSACACGSLNTVERLLENDRPLVNAYAADGWTPLHLAVFFGHDAIVQYLLKKGADVQLISKNDEHNTALHVAVLTRRRHLVSVLLDHEADIDASSAFGTALHYAAYLGDLPILETLLALGADPSKKGKGGRTALELAAKQGHAEAVNSLRLHAR